MSRVIHFEIHADNPARAVQFYRDVFGWDIKQWGDQEYWLCTTGTDERNGKPMPGINGAIIRRRGPAPAEGQPLNAYSCTIQIEQLETSLDSVKSHGGRQVLDIMTIPGVGRVAYCSDSEGNIFGLHEPVAPAS